MDGFTYNNIFESKGIEYIAIICFLVILIPFWYFLNKGTKTNVKIALSILTANILKIPQGIFYSKNHTWTHLEKMGIAKVGIDDLIPHIIGNVQIKMIKKPGEIINKDEVLVELIYNNKSLKIHSPISGEIMDIHEDLSANVLNEDPYDKGWLAKILPSNWVNETNLYYLSHDATNWLNEELKRFKDFLAVKYSEPSEQLILQDGGELKNKVLSELPNEICQDFQREFLD
jgi:glycine cleavage system H protein